MKIDMHTQCTPASECAHHEPELLPQMFKNAGVDAIVLTNHCFPKHCDRLSDDLKEQARIYVDNYKRCKAAGDKIGFRVIFGVEVKLINMKGYVEFLLYGMKEEDFIDSFPLYTLSQKELFDYCNEKDILMIQAHPYRGLTRMDVATDLTLMHGIEVYNPHPLNNGIERFNDTLKLATDNNLLKTAGSDFHINVQAGDTYCIIPDDIEDQFMLRDYMKTRKCTICDRNGVLYEE
ncbi:MAG: hypothetical protein UHE86_04150 [Acutalibacteraceae bacterium]|nr:hypothetical protein [Acutalibacteraceae bacterium]